MPKPVNLFKDKSDDRVELFKTVLAAVISSDVFVKKAFEHADREKECTGNDRHRRQDVYNALTALALTLTDYAMKEYKEYYVTDGREKADGKTAE